MKIIVLGGGAAGFFAAINIALKNKHASVILLEKARALLSKVRVSGGGRCNVTHACFDPKLLVTNYPRGNRALLGPFYRFQPKDTIEWFESRNVSLKEEEDGRIFPVSNTSETIISCLVTEAKNAGIKVLTEHAATLISKHQMGFNLYLQDESLLTCDKLVVATGSNHKIYDLLESLGHTIVPPVPSLFTFTIEDPALHKLSGVTHANAHIKIKGTHLEQTGPLLITHWGFSGPAALKLSAWGARVLHEKNYAVELIVNWTYDFHEDVVKEKLLQCRNSFGNRTVINDTHFNIAKNLWKTLILSCGLSESTTWSMLSNKEIYSIVEKLRRDTYKTNGKSTNKEEFVTAGGVCLDEVDFKTMQSKVCPGLYFAGEVLDIDGVTGGFNFQNAWTTAWITACSIGFLHN
ncbi:MAG: NAD(P)/FAD-dependent oxidoreductase [Chlamydiales bacterium]|nr:NAD(P)/FAD-dependent oxidoreductase [Chlamydiales bacterium]